MKTILCLLSAIALVCNFAGAQVVRSWIPNGPSVLQTSDFSSPARPPVVADPWRILNGEVVKVDGTWLAIAGTVAQVHPKEGIRINGFIEGNPQPADFFLVNFPYQLAENDTFPPAGYVYLVKPAGTYTYNTAPGSTRTIHKYDYGTPCAEPPKSPEQIAAERALAAKRKAEGIAATLKFNQEQAAAGDADAQLRMAERYRDGDGVETNFYKARFLFMASADQGNTDAAKELAALTNAPIKK